MTVPAVEYNDWYAAERTAVPGVPVIFSKNYTLTINKGRIRQWTVLDNKTENRPLSYSIYHYRYQISQILSIIDKNTDLTDFDNYEYLNDQYRFDRF